MSAAAPPAPRRRRAPSPLPVITAGLGLFLIVLTLLALQVRAGKDPSLSAAGSRPALSAPAPQRDTTRIVTRSS
jgi:hypothetical protein